MAQTPNAQIEAARKADLIGLGAGLGTGLVIIGAAMGFGKIGAAALEGMARQPETAGRVQTAMIIIGALLEGATFFALLVCMQLLGKLPAQQ
ncbi:MAG: ATP synthase F0 subunit C [Gemmataceae bacterium]|nr:ATP synthase F0 subunit C [Gemmataceae bacterium]